MKHLPFLFAFTCYFVLLSGCTKDPMMVDPPGPINEPDPIDSVEFQSVNLGVPNGLGYFAIFDFTARIPGSIWGATILEQSISNDNAVVFSFDQTEESIEFFVSPPDFGFRYFEGIAAGPDGKLYLFTESSIRKRFVTFDTNTKTWSVTETPAFVIDIAVDPVSNIVWVLQINGVSQYQNGELLSTFNQANSGLQPSNSTAGLSFGIGEIVVANNGTVWCSAGRGADFYFYTGGEWSRHPSSAEFPNVIKLAPSETGGVWVKSGQQPPALCNEAGVVTVYEGIPGLAENWVYDITDQVFGEDLLYAGGHELVYYDNSLDSLRVIDKSNAVLPDNARFFKFDRDPSGKIWVGGHNFLTPLPEEW